MKREVLNTDAFWSAVKRKNMGEILSAAFIAVGQDEAAEIANDTTRMTDAAITRMRSALDSVGGTMEAHGSVEDEGTDTEDDNTEEVAAKEAVKEKPAVAEGKPMNGSVEEHQAIMKAIKKGKGKKALKLIKAARDGGARGSVLKDLAKQAKAVI